MASIGSLLKKTFIRVFAFAIMVTVGSFVFSILEREHAENTTKSSKATLAKLRKDMALKYNMTKAEFDSFAKRSHEVLGQIGSPNWDYVDSLRFAFETLTTIGYGAITPSTEAGQGLCIAFALLGIPVTILAFQAVGELIRRGISAIIAKTDKHCFNRKPSNIEAKTIVVTCVLVIVMLVSGAGLQMLLEDRSFVAGLYFWFVTLATIGYGDYLPGEYSALSLKVTISLIWTTLGFCVVSSVLNAIAAFLAKRQASSFDACACYCTCDEQDGKSGEGDEKDGSDVNCKENMAYEKNGTMKVNRNGNWKKTPGHYCKRPNLYRSMTYV